ncbi:hypothetical protein CFIMG_007463RA00001 [Ceratocystis fimbriata CBS 114723]|uniref:Extracellular membrane protein CFEM domain-containing protein n=1 Tax=Ceratocystis fimbriata CBS 114723 TaxID=1035309 RepID=A0A2C5X632_9PEZI|nr:hypothetical protein CFIMG_007463RA00001 [Ceratocystis fimbriata CBS 114723]
MKSILLFSLLTSLDLAQARFQNDFSSYPSGAVECLNQSDTTSGCNGDTITIMNACLCGNGGSFVTNTAKCMVNAGHSDDLSATYSVLRVNCQGSGSGLTVSESQFMAAAGVSSSSSAAATTSTSTQPTSSTHASSSSIPAETVDALNTQSSSSTTTASSAGAASTSGGSASLSSSSPSSTTYSADSSTATESKGDSSSSSGGGLSNTAIVGLGAGLGLAGLIAILAFTAFLLRRRSHQKSNPRPDEATNPMLLATGDFKAPLAPGSAYSPSSMNSSPATSMASWDRTRGSSPLPSAYMVNGQWVQATAPPSFAQHQISPHDQGPYGYVPSVNASPIEVPAQTVVYELDSMSMGVQEVPGSQELVHPRAKR